MILNICLGRKLDLWITFPGTQIKKTKKISASDEEFVVANLKLISASVNLIILKPTNPAPHLSNLIQAYDPAHQITSKIEATISAIIFISTHATRVHKHDPYLYPAPRNPIKKTSCKFNNLKYAQPKPQLPINTSILSKRQINVNDLSKIGIICTSQSARLNLLSLISRQLEEIPQTFLKVTTQK